MSLKEKKNPQEAKQAELVRNSLKDDKGYQSPYGGSAEDLLKEMQQEISPEATPLWQYINDHAAKIAAVVVSLVVIIGGYAFYRGYHEGQVDEAKQQLALIISKTDGTKVLAELEEFKSSAPKELKMAVELEIARYAALQEDYAKAQKAYSYVMQEEGYSSLGIVSAMNAAALYAKEENFGEAIKIYEDIVGHCPKDVQSVVYFQLGEMAERVGDKDKAVKAYQDGINLFENADSTDVIFYQGRIKALSE